MTRYTIRCIGFDEQQTDTISAIVDLAGSALINEWTFTETEDSDVVLINMNSELGKQAFSTHQGVLPDYRIILSAESSDENMQGYWFLTKKTMAPPSLRELTELFNQIGTFLSQLVEEKQESVEEPPETQTEPDTQIQQAVSAVTPDKAVVADNRKLLAKNYLFGLVLQAEKDKSSIIISLKQFPVLYVSPEENYFSFAGTDSDLRVLSLALPKQFKVKKVSQSKLLKEEKKDENLVKKPLAILKAQAVIHASQGRILDGHSPELDVILEELPDFEGLPVLAKYRNIAEYMVRKAVNLFSVAENLHVPMSDLFDFYNVCYIFDKITIDYDSAKRQKSAENKNAKTLSLFLKSFFKKS
ncbi:MAG: hypothetical protein ACU84J_01295 [Gammaproteobacteria bacterium]